MSRLTKGVLNERRRKMGTIERHRHHARFDIRWPVLYGNDELLGQGTLLDVSEVDCRVAGTMPVATGMVLNLWVFPPYEAHELYVEEARVLWVNGQEFGFDIGCFQLQDHQCLKDDCEPAERGDVFSGRCGQLRPKRSWLRCRSLWA